MKKLFAILVLLSLLLTACAVEKLAEEASPSDVAVEEPAPLVEEPAVEAPAEEAVEEPAEEAVEEAPAEPVVETPAPSDEQTFEVGKGDSVTYKDTTFTVEDIRNVGNEMYIRFDADAYTLKLSGISKPEILNSVEYEIIDNTDYQTKSKVMLRLKPFVLGENEYLLEKSGTLTVGEKLFTLGEVKYDSSAGVSAYFNAGNYQYWVKLGSTVTVNGLSVTLLRAFYKQRQYAVLKIVPTA
ncbi:MAG: hypothetical protein KJ955_00610 [Nanoarchaeota archaeon]|nr:hypothetical protein [Nanoarchaeota archaeon]